MKRSLIMFGIMSLLVVSLAYAGVLSYYGKIEGIAKVQGPIFYADLTANDKRVGKLLLNTKPTSGYATQFTDGESILFWSDRLGGVDFNYIPKCEFSVKISSNNDTTLKLICNYYDTTNTEHTICYTTITTTTNSEVKTASCIGESPLSNVDYFVYEVKGVATPDVSFTLETNPNGDTRLQVSLPPTINPPRPGVSP
jgi:hypothetical protein